MAKFKKKIKKPEKEERTYFVISPASQDPNDSTLRIKEVNISSDDEEADGFDTFEDYVDYVLEEEHAEAAQHFLSSVAYTASQIEQILKHFNEHEMVKRLIELKKK